MARAAPPSLDATGTQAAVYPSEQELWTVGPPQNFVGSQGVAIPGSEDSDPVPPAPMSAAAAQAQEDLLHEQMNGETSNMAVQEAWLNNRVIGPQGFGDWNEQPFFTGHSQITPSNPASEQGWGVGPARRWAHYPHVDSPNPTRNFGTHHRDGVFPWVVASSTLYERSQLAWEQQWQPYKFRRNPSAVVPVAPSVPWVQTVPAFAGGPAPVPGLDEPVMGDDPGVYWMYPTR